jgi:hypothetical protein
MPRPLSAKILALALPCPATGEEPAAGYVTTSQAIRVAKVARTTLFIAVERGELTLFTLGKLKTAYWSKAQLKEWASAASRKERRLRAGAPKRGTR